MSGQTYNHTVRVVVQGVDQLGPATKQMTKMVTRFGNVAAKVSSETAVAWNTMAMGFMMAGNIMTSMGGKMVSALDEMIGKSVEYELAIAEIATLLGDQADQAYAASDAITDLAIAYGQAAPSVAAGYYYTLSSGITEADLALQSLDYALLAATAGLTDSTTAMNAGITMMYAFKKEATDLNKIFDVQFNMLVAAKTDYEGLAAAMSNVAPMAGRAGQEMEAMGAHFAIATRAVGNAREAGTALAAIYRRIADGGESVKEAFANLNAPIFDAQGNFRSLTDILMDLNVEMANYTEEERAAAVATLFTDRRSKKIVDTLITQAGTLRDLEKEMGKTGTTQQAANEIMDTYDFKIRQANERLADMQRRLAEDLVGAQLMAIEAQIWFLSGLDQTVNALNNLIPGLGDAAGAFLYLAGGVMQTIGPILQSIGMLMILSATYEVNTLSLIKNTLARIAAGASYVFLGVAIAVVTAATWLATAAQRAYNISLYGCPIVWIIAAIVGLIAVLWWLEDTFGAVTWITERLWAGIEGLGRAAKWLWDNSLRILFDGLKWAYDNILKPLWDIIEAIIEGLKEAADRLNNLNPGNWGLPGFKYGGEFTVGGSGPPDSQLVMFMASPEERVTITPPGRGGGGGRGGPVTVNIYPQQLDMGNARQISKVIANQVKREQMR